jgi:hypothetical protein
VIGVPATVSVAIRGVVVVFAEALNVTCPAPVLLEGEIGSHVALLLADHAHPVWVVTPTEPDPPAAASDCAAAGTEYVQLRAAWLTVNVWPAIDSVAVRGVVLVLADALNATVPGPLPVAPPVIASHGALLAAVQAHPP